MANDSLMVGVACVFVLLVLSGSLGGENFLHPSPSPSVSPSPTYHGGGGGGGGGGGSTPTPTPIVTPTPTPTPTFTSTPTPSPTPTLTPTPQPSPTSTPPASTITYFKSSFTYAGTGNFALNRNFPSAEPLGYQIEKGTWHWVNANVSANMKLIKDPLDSSQTCLQMILDQPGTRPLSDNQMSKLYNIQNRETQNWAGSYLTTKEAYYNFKYLFPSNFSVAQDSWRLIWQYNGEDGVYGGLTFDPQFALIFGDSDLQLQVSGFYYANGE
ncbi:MAG: hypothetical protein WC325_09910, partial [Candidatus Bathyarchaeia archaeon]